MGESTFVNHGYAKPKVTSQARQGLDWTLVGVAVGLTLFGLLMVYSAGPKFALANKEAADYFLRRQVIWALIGFIVAAVLTRINYHFYQRFAVLMIIGTLGALMVSLVLSNTTLGANRSLLGGSVRPSEVAKVAVIIYVSVWLNAKRDVLNDITVGLIPLIVILGVTAALIFSQPDLSAAVTIIVLGGILFFLAGGSWGQVGLTVVASIVLGWIILQVYDTGKTRVVQYIAGLQDPLNSSYHVLRSLEAVINGQFFGVGIGHSSTKFTGLPVAPTDSIFAVIAEETGLLGSGLVILAYLVLLWRGLDIARRASDPMGKLLASGLSIWIVFEAFLNMAVMVNLLPQAGNALPFISYGGSSLLATLAGVGILLNVDRYSNAKSSNEGGPFGAVVDLRWRDRGRRVSRPGRSSSTRQ